MLKVVGIIILLGISFTGGYIVNLKELLKLKKGIVKKDKVINRQNNIIKMKNSKFSEISEYVRQNDLGNVQAKLRKIKELAMTAINY